MHTRFPLLLAPEQRPITHAFAIGDRGGAFASDAEGGGRGVGGGRRGMGSGGKQHVDTCSTEPQGEEEERTIDLAGKHVEHKVSFPRTKENPADWPLL